MPSCHYAFTRKDLETLLALTCMDFADAAGFPHHASWDGDDADSKVLRRVVKSVLDDVQSAQEDT